MVEHTLGQFAHAVQLAGAAGQDKAGAGLGGAEEIASSPVDVDADVDRSGLSAAFDAGTD